MVAAVSILPIKWGTSFLFPVVPDVKRTNTSSSAELGTPSALIFATDTQIDSVSELEGFSDRVGTSLKIPASPGSA
jgi:hypothetical protein